MHARIVAAIAGALLAAAPIARAETVPPAQAVADRGAFLEHAPPPAQPAAVCIVDSGVDLNPDTAPQVVYREAIDGGDPGDVSPDKHGTLMAMMAAAPINGWGMVGAAPGAVKIVSIRVEPPGQGTFAFSDYERGIFACLHEASTYDVKVISLSLAGQTAPQGSDLAELQNAVDTARNYGVGVIAGAGNDSGPVESPASYPPVVAVGAADSTSSLCSFSNRGTGLDVAAPGCQLDAADPNTGQPSRGLFQGTSEAAAITASVVTALRAYRPDMTLDQAEGVLTETSSALLDVTAMFEAAGLDEIVRAGGSNSPPLPSPGGIPGSQPAATAPGPSAKTRKLLWPRLQVRLGRRVVVLRAENLPVHMRLRAELIRTLHGDFGASRILLIDRTTPKAVLTMPRLARADHIFVTYLEPTRRIAVSRTRTIGLPGMRR